MRGSTSEMRNENEGLFKFVTATLYVAVMRVFGWSPLLRGKAVNVGELADYVSSFLATLLPRFKTR